MAIKTRPIFNNFSSGEISPKIDGRIDLTQYFNGVQELRDWLCVLQGGAKTRGGFHFVGPSNGNAQARLIPFQFSELQNYMLEFGDQYIRFFMNCGQIMVGNTIELVTNGDFPAGIASWSSISTGTGTVTWDTDHMEISGGATGIGWAEQEITVVDESIYVLEFDVTAFPLTVRIGSTSGDDDILGDTIYAIGADYQIFFTANGTSAFIQFKNTNNNLAELDNVSCQLAIPYQIDSPYDADDDLWSIRFVQDDENLFLVHPLYPPQVLTKGVGHTSFTIEEIDFIDGPYEDEINTPTITPSHLSAPGTEKVTDGDMDVPGSWTAGAGWTIAVGKATRVASAVTTLSQATCAGVNTEIYRVTYTIDSISGGHIQVNMGGVNGTAQHAAGTFIEYITATGVGPLTFTPEAGTACVIDDVSVVKVITLTAATALWDLYHVGALWRIKQGAAWNYVMIDGFYSNLIVYAITITDNPDTTASEGHREGAWSDLNGWPRAICSHDQRLIFASNYEHPQTIWGSKTGKYTNFTPGVLDNDAYSFTPAELNIIRWISSGRVLSIGALNAEATAVGPTDGPITAVDPPRIKGETTHGSSDLIAPVKVGKAILFLQKAARKIREFVYSYTEDAYGAPDITIASEHLFNLDILDLVYQQEPDSILWTIRADGVLLGCTYDRTQDPTKGGIVGWSKHYTDGLFESIASIPYQDKDQLWAIVIRTIGTETKRYVEYYDPDICVDSGLTYSGPPTAIISGLKHLIGKSVVIVGDGAPYPAQIVPASGELTIADLDYSPASEIYVGLAYTPKLVTNRPEVQIAGTSQGLMKAWNKIIVRVLETTGITINGQIVPARVPADPMGTAPVPYSGEVTVANLGWDTEGRITIIQPLPLPAHIISITGDLVIGDS